MPQLWGDPYRRGRLMEAIKDFYLYSPIWLYLSAWLVLVFTISILGVITISVLDRLFGEKHCREAEKKRKEKLDAWLREVGLDTPLANQVAGARLKPKKRRNRVRRASPENMRRKGRVAVNVRSQGRHELVSR